MGLKFKVIPGVITREMNGNISVRPRKTPPPINKARYNMPVFHGILSSLPLLTSAGRRRIRFTSLARSKMHIWTINGILLRVNDKFGRRSIIRYTSIGQIWIQWEMYLFILTTLNFEAPNIKWKIVSCYGLCYLVSKQGTKFAIIVIFFLLLRDWIDVMIQLMNDQLIFQKRNVK